MRVHRSTTFAGLAGLVPLALAATPVQEPGESRELVDPSALEEVVDDDESEERPRLPGAGPELLRCLPAESVLVVSVHDLDAVRATAEGNAWFRFLGDDQVRPLIDAFWSALASEIESGDGAPPVDPAEVLEAIHGSVLAFLVPVGEELEPGVGVVVDPGADSADFAALHERLLDALENEAVPSTDAHDGVELVVFQIRETGIDQPIDTVMSFEFDGLFALVASRGAQGTLELAQGLIDRRRETDGSLGMDDNPWLAGARLAAGATQPFELFLDLGRVLDMTVEQEGMAEEEREALDMLGLFDTRWVYANAGLGAGEALDLGVHVHLPRTGALHGFLDLLGPLPLGLGKLMPRNSTSVGLFNFDLWGLYQDVMDLMEDHYPEQYPMVREQIDGMAQMTGLDVENDFLAQLTGEFGSFSMEVPEDESLMDAAGVFFATSPVDTSMGGATIVGLKDSGVVADFLDQVLEMSGMGAMLATEEFQGHDLQHVTDPGGTFGVWWSFLENSLVFSFYPTAVRSALRNAGSEDAPSVLDNERYSAALQPLTRAPMVSLTDTRTYVRTMLGFGELVGAAATGGPRGGAPAGLTGLSAPEPSLAEEYFSGTMVFAVERGPESVGFRFSTF